MTFLYRLLLLIAFGCPFASLAAANDAQPLRVLFIGNSYTYYHRMPLLLSQLAAASGHALETRAVTAGGASLKDHWREGEAQAWLAKEKWDVVVLQEASSLPAADRRTMQRYVRLFDEQIRQAGARTMLFVTWARADAAASQASLNAAYADIAMQIGAALAPVGPAWAFVRAEHPELRLHEFDDSHPAPAGSLLTAYVFHAVLFGAPPDLSSAPPGLTQAEHRILIDAAAKATQGIQAVRQPAS
jgi:hypothetical protein